MRTKLFLATSLLSLAVISCGQSEDQPQPEIVVDSPPVKISFSISTGEMSRADSGSSDPMPTRAFMYVKDNNTDEILSKAKETAGNNGTFNFDIDLQKTHTYSIAFWADDESYVLDPEKGLDAITYAEESASKPGIAFTYREDNFSPTGKTKQILLTHAVGKLIVRECSELDENDKISVKFERPNYSYSAISGKCTQTSTTQVSLDFTADATNHGGDVISAYLLVPNSSGNGSLIIDDLYLSYTPTGDTEANNRRISVVPFKANHRTVIEGAFKDLSIVSQSFSVTINTEWDEDITPPSGNEDPGEITPPSQIAEIALTSTTRLTESMLNDKLGDAPTLKITGEMLDADFSVLRSYFSVNGTGGSKRIALDLSGALFTTMPEYAFSIDGEDIFEKTPVNPMTALTAITLPEGLASISKGAFIDCQNLKSITIPSTVTTLGELSLYRCGITELNAPSVTFVDVDAVEECHDLTTIILGALTHVGNNAFRNCPALKEMDLTKCASVPTGNNYIFGVGSSTTPSITIYVSSAAIATSFEGNNYWNYKKHNWVVR